MSSDSDFSDDDRKKKGKNKKVDSDDSDSEPDTKRRGKGASSKNFVESDSSDGDDTKPSPSRKRKAPVNKGSAKKRGRGRGSSDEDGPSIPGFDGLELTEEERIKIQGMSEKEREQEIFKRMEEKETRMIREQIAKRLEQKMKKEGGEGEEKERGRGKKKDRRVVSDASDRSTSSERRNTPPPKAKKPPRVESDGSESDVRVNPSELNRKKKQKSAMEDLISKRKEKEAKKASLAVDAVFGKEDSSSDSSSSQSSRSSSPSSRSSRSRSRSRGSSPSKEDLLAKRPVESLQELLAARLSRFKLARFVHAPFFNKTVIDCYVRIGVGAMPGRTSKDNYRIAQIVDVVETGKVYDVENTKTNKGLKLRMGTEDRVYRLEFVSNSEFTQNEFNEWMGIMKRHNRSIPTMGDLQKKQRDIANAMNHAYTNDEVDAMIKEKARFKPTPKNFAMTKGELMKKLEYAKQNGQSADVQRLQQEIDKLDSEADRLDKTRAGDITSIDWINKRNRNMMKESFLGEKKIEGFFGKGDDPFTRKSGKMRVVSGSAKNLTALDEEGGALSASSSSSNLAAAAAAAPKTPAPPTPSTSKTPKPSDLFSLHAVKLDLNLDLDSLRTPVNDDASSRTIHPTSTPSSRGRPLSLEDYKKRKLEGKTATPSA